MNTYDVAVVGAGMAGLAAANYLQNYNIIVLEATARVGGRVFTKRLPDGTHLEQGAYSFGNGEQPLSAYISKFALPLIQNTQMETTFEFKNYKGTMNEKGLFLKGKEREIPLCQLLDYFVCQLEKVTKDISLLDALQSIGASSEAIEWLQTISFIGTLGNFETVSVKAALAFLKQYDDSTAFYSLQGGNDQIPHAFAEKLKRRILYDHRVETINQIGMIFLQGKNFTIATKKVIFAIPLHELNQLQINPPLSLKKQQWMQRISYTKHARISIVAPPNVLTRVPQGGVFMYSDQAGSFRYQSAFQVDPHKKTVIDVSVAGEKAEKLTRAVEEWRNSINNILSKNFPNWDSTQAKYYLHVWKKAYSCFPPTSYEEQNSLYEPEGNFHFAGEHTSKKFASINGAMESGIRVAKEIIQNNKQKFTASL